MKTAEIYDIKWDKWTSIADMGNVRSDGHAVFVDDRFAIFGGFDGSQCHRTGEFYEPERDAWYDYRNQMRTPRSGVSAVVVNGAVFITGGFNGVKRLNSTEFMDPREGLWHSARSMSKARSNFAIEQMDGRIYVSGGFDGSSTTEHTEMYDFRYDAWQQLSPMSVCRSAGFSAVVEYHDIVDSLTHPTDVYKVPEGDGTFRQILGVQNDRA
ncbi:hypothetical protein L596_027322 [Steinernema carpocapsae]|uniref:Uncharacterized protein n=1 Tax=Steinernema carpocapsae TaxID=34508 RepID=A0A4U5M410_STECR|nr:hypothetical protein L596_027322 [Steinernema carpocapsae]